MSNKKAKKFLCFFLVLEAVRHYTGFASGSRGEDRPPSFLSCSLTSLDPVGRVYRAPLLGWASALGILLRVESKPNINATMNTDIRYDIKDIYSLFERVDSYLADMGLVAHYVEDYKELDNKLSEAMDKAYNRDVKAGLFTPMHPDSISEQDCFNWGFTRGDAHPDIERIDRQIEELIAKAELREQSPINTHKNSEGIRVCSSEWYGYDGDNVLVIELLPNGKCVVESQQNGQEEVSASKLRSPYPVRY
jgi:hypothetical protein